MVCLGFEPGAEGWYAQTKPRSYGGHPQFSITIGDRCVTQICQVYLWNTHRSNANFDEFEAIRVEREHHLQKYFCNS